MITINNPDDHNWKEVKQHLITLYFQETIRYMAISSLEIGEEGTPHYHVLILLSQQVDQHILMEKYLLNTSPHVDFIRSTDKSNHYVLKPINLTNGEICPCEHCQKQFSLQPKRLNAPEIYGVITHQGLKQQLVSMKQEIDGGEVSLNYHLENHPVEMARHIGYFRLCLYSASEKEAYDRFHRIQDAYDRNDLQEVLRLRPIIEVLWGPTGSGKSKKVYAGHRRKVCRPSLSRSKVWFDTYEISMQDCCIDEYYGQTVPDWLLTFMDIYPQSQEVKGGMIFPVFDRITITSNVHPDFWWRKSRHLFPRDKMEALNRRFTEGHNRITCVLGNTYNGLTITETGQIMRQAWDTGLVTMEPAEAYIYAEQKKEYLTSLDEIQAKSRGYSNH